MNLERTYVCEVAHQLLAGVPDGHPCRRLHGHRYEITISIMGDVNPETGMLLEYAEIDKRIDPVLALLDHRFLNELGFNAFMCGRELIVAPIEGLDLRRPDLAEKVRENSTIENVGAWLVEELRERFPRDPVRVGPASLRPPQILGVSIKEDPRSSINIYAGEKA